MILPVHAGNLTVSSVVHCVKSHVITCICSCVTKDNSKPKHGTKPASTCTHICSCALPDEKSQHLKVSLLQFDTVHSEITYHACRSTKGHPDMIRRCFHVFWWPHVIHEKLPQDNCGLAHCSIPNRPTPPVRDSHYWQSSTCQKGLFSFRYVLQRHCSLQHHCFVLLGNHCDHRCRQHGIQMPCCWE
jgi:hypothetical protein